MRICKNKNIAMNTQNKRNTPVLSSFLLLESIESAYLAGHKKLSRAGAMVWQLREPNLCGLYGKYRIACL